jgi:hypothetical protein
MKINYFQQAGGKEIYILTKCAESLTKVTGVTRSY